MTEEFLVPPDKIGVAIGKGGNNLKNMRTKFNGEFSALFTVYKYTNNFNVFLSKLGIGSTG